MGEENDQVQQGQDAQQHTEVQETRVEETVVDSPPVDGGADPAQPSTADGPVAANDVIDEHNEQLADASAKAADEEQ